MSMQKRLMSRSLLLPRLVVESRITSTTPTKQYTASYFSMRMRPAYIRRRRNYGIFLEWLGEKTLINC
ncbi:MAG: hypothetical protein QW707_09930, partial [Candidatus Bathyarchaeia archaeon]